MAALGLLAGCGGHRASGSSAATDDIVFDNGKVAPVTDAAKAADEAKLDAVFGTSWSPDGSAMAHRLVEMMRTMPEFREGGISTDGTAWGRYTDGLYTAYFTNDPDAPAASGAAARAVSAPSGVQTAPRGKVAASAKDLPEKPVAYVFSSLEAARSGPIPAIANELATAGYAVRSQGGSLDEWSHVNGAGVLVNNSHGAAFGGTFYVQTSDQLSDTLTSQYKAEIDAGHIASGAIDVIDDSPQGFHIEKHYIFRSEFLESQSNYASMFGKNSLFFNLSCSGGSREASRFYGPMFAKASLSVYGGWNQTVLSDDTLELAGFFFDRALGLNEVAPIDPGKPAPASLVSLESTLGTAAHQDGNPGAMNHSSTVYGGKKIPVSFSLFRASNQSLTTLIPSEISAGLTTDGQNLQIEGDFGADRGTVTVAGASVAVVSWSEKEIIAAQPTTGGAVVVTSPTGLKGNPVTLSGILSLDPAKPSVAFGSTTTFTVSNNSGAFPTGAQFTWTVKGTGTVGGSSTTTTSVSHVDYLAPSKAASDTLTVAVKAADGTSLGVAGTVVTVNSVFNITPSSLPVGVPLYGGSFAVADVSGLPSGVKYVWTAKLGTLQVDYQTPGGQTVTTAYPRVYYTASDPFPATGSTVTDNVTLQILDSSGNEIGTGSAVAVLGGASYMDITYPFSAAKPAYRYTGATRSPTGPSIAYPYNAYQLEIPNGNGGDFVDIELVTPVGSLPSGTYTWKLYYPGTIAVGDLYFDGQPAAGITSGTLTINSSIPAPDGGTFIGYSFHFETTSAPVFGNGVQSVHL